MKKLAKKGFTLVEMLVVIAIIAILVAIIIPTTSTATTKAKASTDAANLRALVAEATIDFLDNDQLDNEYKMTSKLLAGDEKTVKFYNTLNGLVALYPVTTGSGESATTTYYSIDAFAKVATSGKKDDATGTTPDSGWVALEKGTVPTTTPTK